MPKSIHQEKSGLELSRMKNGERRLTFHSRKPVFLSHADFHSPLFSLTIIILLFFTFQPRYSRLTISFVQLSVPCSLSILVPKAPNFVLFKLSILWDHMEDLWKQSTGPYSWSFWLSKSGMGPESFYLYQIPVLVDIVSGTTLWEPLLYYESWGIMHILKNTL